MSNEEPDLVPKIRNIVAEHYEKNGNPMLLADLGLQLRRDGIWQPDKAQGKTLRRFIEAAHDPDLLILRDPRSPAYVAVSTAAHKSAVETWIGKRGQASTTVPDLELLPRSVLVAFCVEHKPDQRVFLNRYPPFKYELRPAEDGESDHLLKVDDRYRRPGLNTSAELSASDRLDLQTKIASWSRDINIPIDTFYVAAAKKSLNALERLIAVQPHGVAERMVIPADIALLLSRQQ